MTWSAGASAAWSRAKCATVVDHNSTPRYTTHAEPPPPPAKQDTGTAGVHIQGVSTMTAATRIYLVTAGEDNYLVRASHPSRAIAHVVEKHLGVEAEVPSAEQLVQVVEAGVKVESAAP